MAGDGWGWLGMAGGNSKAGIVDYCGLLWIIVAFRPRPSERCEPIATTPGSFITAGDMKEGSQKYRLSIAILVLVLFASNKWKPMEI